MADFELVRGAESTQLAPGYALRAPGIVGRGEFSLPAAGVRRSTNTHSLGHLDKVLADLDVTERAVATFNVDPASTVVQARRSGAVGASEAVELDVPPPPAGFEQVVLAANDDGTVTWHVAYDTPPASRRRGAGALRRYHVPLRASAPSPAPDTQRRGVISILTRRVVKVLLFPITDVVFGPLEFRIARAYEKAKAPYGVRTFDVTNYRQAGVGALTPADWTRLGQGPALLFVHGTFSSAHGGFNRLTPDTMAELGRLYGGRVFALDHWTLSHDPKENVKWFVEQIPAGLSLDVDIVCHSRGGLVSRVLAHAADEVSGLPGRVHVGRITFVATPNDGTLLAHPDNIVTLLDRYTNVVEWLPDGPVEVALELIVTAVKTLAHAGLTHLPGLAAQSPDSTFLRWLRGKAIGDTGYYAIAADWNASDDSPLKELVKHKVADHVTDRVFMDAKNDLVVPTDGVANATGNGFPIDPARVFTYAADAGAIHTNLFGLEATSKQLLDWLGAPRQGR